MKYLPLALILFLGACASQSANNNLKTNAPTVEKLLPEVRAFLVKPPPTPFNGVPVVTYITDVAGISLHRKEDNFYIVTADVRRKNGDQDTFPIIARLYGDGNKTYWKIEDCPPRVLSAANPCNLSNVGQPDQDSDPSLP